MTEFIFDQKTGGCIKRIANGEVFRDTKSGEKIGTVRDRKVYDLDNNLVGHLQSNGLTGLEVVAPVPNEMAPAFRKLLG
jgi:hypothetical protein